MGLATVYGIVKNHGGLIRMNSEVVEGNNVQGVPAAPPGRRPARSHPSGPKPPVRGDGRILVVDDEPVVRDLAETMLTSLGYEVTTAANGHEAVELYRRLAATPSISCSWT
jgi:hypothetical protein